MFPHFYLNRWWYLVDTNNTVLLFTNYLRDLILFMSLYVWHEITLSILEDLNVFHWMLAYFSWEFTSLHCCHYKCWRSQPWQDYFFGEQVSRNLQKQAQQQQQQTGDAVDANGAAIQRLANTTAVNGVGGEVRTWTSARHLFPSVRREWGNTIQFHKSLLLLSKNVCFIQFQRACHVN